MNNIMPRFGFAWDVFGDGKSSIRGGAGLFYDSRIGGAMLNSSPAWATTRRAVRAHHHHPIRRALQQSLPGHHQPVPVPQPPPRSRSHYRWRWPLWTARIATW
jgi:hypothetical protein